MTTSRPAPTFWRVGLVIQLLSVSAIGTMAYLHWLPPIGRLGFSQIDLVLHALLIGLVAFFLEGTLQFRPLLRGRWSFVHLAPCLVLLLAGIEELAQALSPNRTCSFSDFVADLVGVCFFSWLAWRVECWRRRRLRAG